MGRNEVVLVDEQGRERARHRSLRRQAAGRRRRQEVKRGDKIAEWDPYTLPIITEREGTSNYEDLVEGTSMRETMDETTGISKRVVIDWKQQPRGRPEAARSPCAIDKARW
jgi:DNA-directed RNA polymerase subunit beta'